MLSPGQQQDSEILESINRARVALDLAPLRKLPRGIPETSRKCVLGRSLGVEILLDDLDRVYALLFSYSVACKLQRAWGAARPYGMWNGWAVSLPEELNTFVHEFDARRYPHLTYPESEAKEGVRSELRHLRFDWIGEHSKVVDLIERARQVSDRALAALNRGQSSGFAADAILRPKTDGSKSDS